MSSKRKPKTTGKSAVPTLTVVTPSLNQAEFLEEAIRSVLDQAYPNLEYIVMDGGSTDGSPDIIRKYEKHLTFWESVRDEGQSDALMKGFARGTGEWLAWLNADDFYLPGAFAAFADAASASGIETALLFGEGEVLDQQHQRRKFWPHPACFDRNALLYGLDYIVQPATFFRRSALDAVGPLRRDYHYCMDYDLWLRISFKFGVKVIDHPIAVSREHAATKTAGGGFRRWLEIQTMIASHANVPADPGAHRLPGSDYLSAHEERAGPHFSGSPPLPDAAAARERRHCPKFLLFR